MKLHTKKKWGVWLSVAGVLAVLAAYGFFYAWAVRALCLPGWVLPVIGLILAAVAVVILAAARSRIKEINGGEEDDLSQY